MPGSFEKEKKIMLWLLVGLTVQGLTATFVWAIFSQDSVDRNSAPIFRSNDSGLIVITPREAIFVPATDTTRAEPVTNDSIEIPSGMVVRPKDKQHSPRQRDGLNPLEIAGVVQAKYSGIKYCFEKEEKYTPGIGGIVVVNFTIGADGGTNQYKIESSTLFHSGVESCILRMIRRWRFPRPINGDVNVSYPFIFVSHPTNSNTHDAKTEWPCDGYIGAPHIQDAQVNVVASGSVTTNSFKKEIECKVGCWNKCALEWAEESSQAATHPDINFSVRNDGHLKNIKVRSSSKVARCISKELEGWVLQPSVDGANVSLSVEFSKQMVTPAEKLRCPEPHAHGVNLR